MGSSKHATIGKSDESKKFKEMLMMIDPIKTPNSKALAGIRDDFTGRNDVITQFWSGRENDSCKDEYERLYCVKQD